MNPRSIGSIVWLALFSACDGGKQLDPIQNGVTDCDADDDGVEGPECDGDDCDDDDPDVFPGADDPMDDVDQSCDGDPNASITVVEMGQGDPLGAGISDNGLRVGGVVAGSDGHVYGRTAMVGGGIEQHDYGTLGLYADGVRTYDGNEAIDVLAVADGADYRLETHRGEDVFDTLAGPGMLTDLDATLDGNGQLRAIACGGGNIAYQQLDVSTGATVVSAQAEWPAHDRCVVLASDDEPVIVTGSSAGGTLVRLRVTDAGFDDYLVLASDVATERLVAATAGNLGLFGYVDDGDVLVFDVDGHATALGGAESVLDLAVDIAPSGEAAIGWVDDTGAVHLAFGAFPDRLVEIALEPSAWPDRIAVAVTDGGATVALWEGTHIEVAKVTR